MKWKSLHMPRFVEIDESTRTDFYGKFIVQPLERGFGITLGNTLRRVLLSSIQGSAIRSVRIDGVHHEFSIIPNIVEDVPEIVLNLKEVQVKLLADEDKTIVVEKNGRSELIAGDLAVDSQIEIMNPDLHIADLGEGGKLSLEITVGSGRGYVLAEDNKLPDVPVGTITLDSIFSPVQKVNYQVEHTRVGRRTDYDKLTLEVWTNGVVRPDDAVSYAAKILKDHLELFINFEEEPIEEEEKGVDEEAERIKNLLRMPVDELELSVRSANCLRAAGIVTLRDLIQKTEAEMLKYRNFGRKSLNELCEILADLGLHFGMDMSQYEDTEEVAKSAFSEEEFL